MPRIFDNIELKLFPALCETLQVPPAWKGALDDGRLRLLSPFEEQYRRATTALAIRRNRFVADVADEVFIAHAAPGGKTEQFCRKLVAEGSRQGFQTILGCGTTRRRLRTGPAS